MLEPFISETFLITQLVIWSVEPANSLRHYFLSRSLLYLLFRSEKLGNFVLLFYGISHFISICCYCQGWRCAFAPKRPRFIGFFIFTISAQFGIISNSLLQKTSDPFATLAVGLYFLCFTFRSFCFALVIVSIS